MMLSKRALPRKMLLSFAVSIPLLTATSSALAQSQSPEKASEAGFSAVIYGKSEITIKTRTQGEIVELRAQEGQNITRGEIIARLDDRQERIDREAAENEYKFAKEDFERTSKLKKYVSEDEIRQKQANYLKKKSTFEVKSLDFDKKRINSPIDGIVTRLHFERGETVAPGDKFADVVQMDELFLIANVPSSEVRRFKVGNLVAFSVDGLKETFKAKVIFLSPVIDASSDTVRIKLETKNPTQASGGKTDFVIRPGMVAQLRPEPAPEK